MKLLVIGREADAVVEWMIDPLLLYRRKIRKQLGFEVEVVKAQTFDAIRSAVEERRSDVVFLTTSWREPADATIEFVRSLDAMPRRPRLVYLDYFDQSSSPYFGVLPYVDRYVKKQLLRDLDAYSTDFAGGYVFSDHMARRGFDLGGWSFGSKVPDGCADRLMLGWNLGTARHLQRGMQSSVRAQRDRDVDVNCRVSFGPEPASWYAAHRQEVLDALQPFAGDARAIVGGGPAARVPLKQFHEELRRSRIGVSPFGWGEVTDRDFHTINSGALLLKPDMSHLVTEPDIYRDGETYAAVRWDLTNVEERCRHYLDRPDEAQRIAESARAVYADYFASGAFLDRLATVLDGLF